MLSTILGSRRLEISLATQSVEGRAVSSRRRLANLDALGRPQPEQGPEHQLQEVPGDGTRWGLEGEACGGSTECRGKPAWPRSQGLGSSLCKFSITDSLEYLRGLRPPH